MSKYKIDRQDESAHCPLCPRACSIDGLGCGRGRAHFSGEGSADSFARQDYGEGGGHHHSRHDHHHDHHGHHGRHHDCDGHHHGRHEKHGHSPCPDDGSLLSLFARCSHTLRRAGGKHVAQERVLRILARQEDGMGQRQLQELLGIQSGSLSELVSKLEGKGLLTRVRDEADKRNVTLLLTDAGRAAVGPEERPDPFAVLSGEEQEMLRALLQKLLDGQEAAGRKA